MANHSLSIKKLHKLISHIVAGKSKRSIAVMLKVSRHTIDNYLCYLKAEIGEDLSPLLSWDEESLNRLVTRQNDSNTQQSLELLFPEYEKELSKVGMTRMILWDDTVLALLLILTTLAFVITSVSGNPLKKSPCTLSIKLGINSSLILQERGYF